MQKCHEMEDRRFRRHKQVIQEQIGSSDEAIENESLNEGAADESESVAAE